MKNLKNSKYHVDLKILEQFQSCMLITVSTVKIRIPNDRSKSKAPYLSVNSEIKVQNQIHSIFILNQIRCCIWNQTRILDIYFKVRVSNGHLKTRIEFQLTWISQTKIKLPKDRSVSKLKLNFKWKKIPKLKWSFRWTGNVPKLRSHRKYQLTCC